jgi:hypothetical protein
MDKANKTVQRQVVLPWMQVVRIAYNSMKVRFFRSLITTLTLALAIAFIAYLQSGYEILNALWPGADDSLRARILAIGYELSGGEFGSTPKDRWLVILSLLVCVVGIVNAQLMAVTERFREIGTYKCLGALDSFVVRIFVLEAMYQGLLGGIGGSLAGVLTATFTLFVRLGFPVLLSLPLVGILQTVAMSSLLAVFLSFLGVLYPALVAARMQPAVALRREE